MSFFRHAPEVRAAQDELNTYSEQQRRAGNHEETPEFLRLNDRVNDALRQERSRTNPTS